MRKELNINVQKQYYNVPSQSIIIIYIQICEFLNNSLRLGGGMVNWPMYRPLWRGMDIRLEPQQTSAPSEE